MRLFLAASLGAAVCAASSSSCSDETDVEGSGAGSSGSSGPSGSKSALPCDIAPIIEANCLGCHGDPPSSSAPQSLVTVDQWKAPSRNDPAKTNGQLSVERMSDAARSMPPAGPIAQGDIDRVAEWVGDGMPGGECDPMTPLDPVLNAEPVCTSMDFWPAGEDEVPGKERDEMMPGMPCIDCHANPEKYGFDDTAPVFAIGGTIFPTGHEPDYCAGLDGTSVTDVVIHIEDAAGKTWDLHPNAAGNFLIDTGVVYPYSARVVSSTGVRAMSYEPSIGDCNLCHTQEGSNGGDPNSPTAPGRIVVPVP